MTIFGKALKVDLLKLSDELKIPLDGSASIIEIRQTIQAMEKFTEEADYIKELLETIRDQD